MVENVKGMTKAQQKACINKINAQGMTVTGWARANKVSLGTIRNVLYREYGRRTPLTESGAKIVTLLREQGLAGDRS